jgi:type II secretory pathway pseudopilin PulG
MKTVLINGRSRRCAAGFGLIELLVVLCVQGILMAALAMSFTSQLRSHRLQERMSAMQQIARAAMALITREARMAGYDPTGIPFSGITYDADALRILADLNGDGDVADANESVVYAHDAATQRLTRNTGGGRQSVAEQVETFAFEYRDANGLPTEVEQEIRQLRLRITVRTAKPDPRYEQNGGYRTYTLESLITPPNLAL